MRRRGLSADVVSRVLTAPDQRWVIRPGREVLQAKVVMGVPPELYLVRVFVDVEPMPNEVVTAYRTSKIDKYWRREP